MQRVPWSCKPCPNVCGCIHGKQAVANQFTPEILSGVEGYDRRRALPFSGIWPGAPSTLRQPQPSDSIVIGHFCRT